MKNPVFFFALLVLASNLAFCQSPLNVAPKKHPITTKGDTIFYDGELVGAKLAKNHLKQGKFILLRGGKTAPFTECQQSMLAEMNLEVLNAYGCIAEGFVLTQVRAYNEAVKAYFKAKKGIPDIQTYYRQQLANCNPMGCG